MKAYRTTTPPRPSLLTVSLAVSACVLVLWVIWLADTTFGLNLVRFGVYPHSVFGLRGILFGPLIHGSSTHILANTAPLLVLSVALFYGYPRSAWLVLVMIYFGSGLGVWLFARESYHIGASGVTHGLMFFIFVVGILRRDRRAIALSLMVFFLYGSMVWGIFPRQPGISFESHFFGAAMGVALAIALRNRDPRPPEKRYSWEDEAEDEDDPVIGDDWRHGSSHYESAEARGAGLSTQRLGR